MSELIRQLRENAARCADKVAIWVAGVGDRAASISYGKLMARVDQIAARLARRIDSPATVPLWATKQIDTVAIMFALLGIGSAFAALSRKLRRPQIEQIQRYLDPPLSLLDRVVLAEILSANSDRVEPVPIVRRDADSIGCCLFTSGSTGVPKGVLVAEHDLFNRAKAEVECFGLTSDDVLLSVLPFSFDVGLNQLLSGIIAGCTIVLSESWLPADLIGSCRGFGVTGISGVPAIWNDLLNSGLRLSCDRLRYITVSGGDLPVERLKQLEHSIDPASIFKTYGQSETFRSAALLPSEFANKPGSVGRAFGGARVYVVRPDQSRANPGEPGEIVHAGLGTMLRYLDGDSPNLRANPFHGQLDPSPRAIFTGDIGSLDADGFLYVHGRRDAMLKIAGNRVYPQEITNQLALLSAVTEAEIAWEKDPLTNETTIKAFVVPQGDAAIDRARLRRDLAQKLPSFMIPRDFVIVDALPRTASGKIDRLALTKQR